MPEKISSLVEGKSDYIRRIITSEKEKNKHDMNILFDISMLFTKAIRLNSANWDISRYDIKKHIDEFMNRGVIVEEKKHGKNFYKFVY